MNDNPPALSADEFASLFEVSKGAEQREIPQLHWERLVGLGYAPLPAEIATKIKAAIDALS